MKTLLLPSAFVFFCFLSGFSQTASDKLVITDKPLSDQMVSDKAVSQPVSPFALTVETVIPQVAATVVETQTTDVIQINMDTLAPQNLKSKQTIITVPVQKIEESQPAQKPENKKAAKNN